VTFGYSIYYMDTITWGRTREITAVDTPNEPNIKLDLDLDLEPNTPTPSEIVVCDTVVACPPKEIMEEFMSKYCRTNVYELLSDTNDATNTTNNIYEITI